MPVLNLLNNKEYGKKIGVVFTPLDSCKQVILESGLFEKWLNGKTFLDPTAGEGNFIEAFIELANEQGITVDEQMLMRLYANELEVEYIENFFNRMQKKFGLAFPKSNFFNNDIILDNLDLKVDYLIGNPPWANFNDLPDAYKQKLKPSFLKYDLVKNAKDLLLGGSRIDIAALVCAKTLKDHLRQNGEAYYFLPLSIFLNGDAHKGFRSYTIDSIHFSVKKIIDYKDADVFDGLVATRYGFVTFQRDEKQTFPIDYHITKNGVRIAAKAKPLYGKEDALNILLDDDAHKMTNNRFEILINEDQKPRQGINTCGRNETFIFDSYTEIDSDLVQVRNKNREAILPRKFVFPLLTRSVLMGESDLPEKWVLIPYDQLTGKMLVEEQVQLYPQLFEYLIQNRDPLLARKGTLIQAGMKKGPWWSLLGVGPYSFAPYKICWQAYGDKKFTVKLFDGRWQANQSMHAFVPAWDKQQADELLSRFQDPFIEKYLLSQRMEGTCNWAQPGKISKLLKIQTKQNALFELSPA